LKTDLVPQLVPPKNADMPLSHRSLTLWLAILAASGVVACNGPPVRLRANDRAGGAMPSEKVPTEANIAEQVATVIELHNEERARQKRPSLAVNPRLQKAATRHARDMADRKKMAHKGSDGSSPMDRIKQAGYSYQRAGENIAYGRFRPERLMQGWMDSPPHKKNILGSYSQIGVACAIAEDGTSYWCVTFGLPIRP